MYRLATAAAALALAAATACGTGADPAAEGPRRTVDVTMRDIAFDPAALSVAKGETVTFRFTNRGRLAHDAYVGDAHAQQEHEEEMASSHGSDDGHGHAGRGDAVTVQAGATGELTHTFDTAGTFEVGCHQPGHYGAGMKIVVTVA